MNNESGRSLIEMLGVLALGGMLAFAAVKMYQTARTRQTRFMAEQELKELAENAKIIYSGRKNYAGISKSYLIKTGALKVEKIAGMDFSITSPEDGKTFSIIFANLDMGACAYFGAKKFDWSIGTVVNGIAENPATFCSETAPNKLEFIVK